MFNKGDKVVVTKNNYRYMESFKGKRGKVVGAITAHSCRVKIVGGREVWFSNEELELES